MRRDAFPKWALVLSAVVSPGVAHSQAVDVHANITIAQNGLQKISPHTLASQVVVWLKPLNPPASYSAPQAGKFRMAQKGKSFHPHLLIIPLGSTVSFPNLDPFFHNVFSQFDGKRFDLGLYESGSTRDVHFDHEGVSYIFCNIHPEMSAVIITVSSPWYAISTGGPILLHAVSPGMYEVHVWASNADARELEALTRKVRIGPDANSLGTISIRVNARPETHKNKFGDDYRATSSSAYR